MTNVILDANILVLYAVGATRSDLLGKRRRVKEFNPRDYELLLRVLSPFGGIALTPNVVTECSDLLGDGPDDDFAKENLKALLERDDVRVIERYVPSREAMRLPQYRRLGVADCSLLSLVDRNHVLLSTDRKLVHAAQQINCDSCNFTTLRDFT